MRILVSTLIIALILVLSGCGANEGKAIFRKKKKPIPTVSTMNIDVTARASINPDSGSHPYSVAVRVYQLRDSAIFEGASYDDLLWNDRSVLSEDFQDGVSAVVQPSGAVSLTQSMKPDTQFVAVAVFFRDISENNAWRIVVPRSAMKAPGAPLRFELIGSDIKQVVDPASTKDGGKGRLKIKG